MDLSGLQHRVRRAVLLQATPSWVADGDHSRHIHTVHSRLWQQRTGRRQTHRRSCSSSSLSGFLGWWDCLRVGDTTQGVGFLFLGCEFCRPCPCLDPAEDSNPSLFPVCCGLYPCLFVFDLLCLFCLQPFSMKRTRRRRLHHRHLRPPFRWVDSCLAKARGVSLACAFS